MTSAQQRTELASKHDIETLEQLDQTGLSHHVANPTILPGHFDSHLPGLDEPGELLANTSLAVRQRMEEFLQCEPRIGERSVDDQKDEVIGEGALLHRKIATDSVLDRHKRSGKPSTCRGWRHRAGVSWLHFCDCIHGCP